MRITRRSALGLSAGLAVAGLGGLASEAYAGTTGSGHEAATDLSTPPTTAGRRGLVGSTVPASALKTGCYCAGDTQDTADAAWESVVGRRMSVTKKYNYDVSVFPTDLSVNDIDRYIARGVKVCLSFKPAFNPVSIIDANNFRNTLALYHNSGLNAEVCLWQEAGNAGNSLNPQQYQDMYAFYGPTVREFYPLVANLNYADLTVTNFTDYAQLVTGLVDKFAIDYYYNNFGAKHWLDAAADIADQAGLPFGIWECSTGGPGASAPDQTAGTAYMNYIRNFMLKRLADGKTNADVIWFDGLCAVLEPNGQPDPILSRTDYRVALYQKMWEDLSSAA
jgi:hypothetical protein